MSAELSINVSVPVNVTPRAPAMKPKTSSIESKAQEIIVLSGQNSSATDLQSKILQVKLKPRNHTPNPTPTSSESAFLAGSHELSEDDSFAIMQIFRQIQQADKVRYTE